jgi:hypothetical protein
MGTPLLLSGVIGFGFILAHPEKLPIYDPQRPFWGTLSNVLVGVSILGIMALSVFAGSRMVRNALGTFGDDV